LALLYGILAHLIFRKLTPHKIDQIFRKGQLFSTAIYCMGHGGNDAQKTMGIIASLLFSAGLLGDKFYIPLWIVLACYSTLTMGIICGGWRIVKTMGQKIVKLRPIDGFCAESGAGTLLYLASVSGIPVSTTHTITGGIMGVGALKRFSAVKWGVARRIVWAWIFTIPCSAVIAAITYGAAHYFQLFK
jgi:PiT family inorganic phosphate transporter